MRERFTRACNSNQLIILASKEGNLPRHAAAGGKVEGDWAKIGLRGAVASIGFAAPFFFYVLGFLVMASSWGLFF
jgi:arginine/ornithine N-succinyltransferase beta subunit